MLSVAHIRFLYFTLLLQKLPFWWIQKKDGGIPCLVPFIIFVPLCYHCTLPMSAGGLGFHCLAKATRPKFSPIGMYMKMHMSLWMIMKGRKWHPYSQMCSQRQPLCLCTVLLSRMHYWMSIPMQEDVTPIASALQWSYIATALTPVLWCTILYPFVTFN